MLNSVKQKQVPIRKKKKKKKIREFFYQFDFAMLG